MFVAFSIVGNILQGISSVIIDISAITIIITVFPGHTTILVSCIYQLHLFSIQNFIQR